MTLNLLISIISDTYDRVRDTIAASDLKLKAELMLGIEQIARFFKRGNRIQKKQYLHYFEYLGEINNEGVGEGWKTKIREIKRGTEDVLHMVSNLKKDIKKDIENCIDVQ